MRKVLESGYVDTGSPTVGSSRSWKSMEMEIQSLLEKLLDINDSMSRCAASATPATSVTQKLARHRDILHEYTQVPGFSSTVAFATAYSTKKKQYHKWNLDGSFFFFLASSAESIHEISFHICF